MLAEAQRLGLGVINVHKGFPALLGSGADEYVREPRPAEGARATGSELRFVAYHSGYFPGEGIGEFLGVAKSIPRKHRKRLYAEIGSCFATAFLEGPESAAHLVGSLLKALGSEADRVGDGLDLVGLAAVADRRLQGARDPREDAGAASAIRRSRSARRRASSA